MILYKSLFKEENYELYATPIEESEVLEESWLVFAGHDLGKVMIVSDLPNKRFWIACGVKSNLLVFLEGMKLMNAIKNDKGFLIDATTIDEGIKNEISNSSS